MRPTLETTRCIYVYAQNKLANTNIMMNILGHIVDAIKQNME